MHTNHPGEIQDEAEHAKIAIRWELLPFKLLLTNCAACGSPKKGCCSYHRLSVLASWPQLFSYGMWKGDIKTCWIELFNCCEQETIYKLYCYSCDKLSRIGPHVAKCDKLSRGFIPASQKMDTSASRKTLGTSARGRQKKMSLRESTEDSGGQTTRCDEYSRSNV